MTTDRLKEIIGSILYVCTIVLLATYCLSLMISFAIAAHDHRIPGAWWVRNEDHHGPWHYYEPVCTLFRIALASVLCGALIGGTNLEFMKGWRSVWVAVIALAMAIIHMVFLNWLAA